MTLTELDSALARAASRPRFLAGPDASIDPERLVANFAAVEAELDAPAPSRLARLLGWFGVDEGTVPLVTATPALRRSWIGAVAVAVLFAISAASSSTSADDVGRIVVFLTLAPLVPVAGVALAFGPRVDPTHDVAVAAPIDGFRLFVIRAITVVGASIVVLAAASLLVPTGGVHRIAWLLPALGTTSATMAASTRVDARRAAAIVAAVWLGAVTVAVNVTGATATFGPPMQLGSLVAAVAGAAELHRRRRRLDVVSDR